MSANRLDPRSAASPWINRVCPCTSHGSLRTYSPAPRFKCHEFTAPRFPNASASALPSELFLRPPGSPMTGSGLTPAARIGFGRRPANQRSARPCGRGATRAAGTLLGLEHHGETRGKTCSDGNRSHFMCSPSRADGNSSCFSTRANSRRTGSADRTRASRRRIIAA
jgi:hypothetical protein